MLAPSTVSRVTTKSTSPDRFLIKSLLIGRQQGQCLLGILPCQIFLSVRKIRIREAIVGVSRLWISEDVEFQDFNRIFCFADRLRLQCEAKSFLTTWPSFITNRTRSISVMSAIGSPLTATRSANFPGSIAPMRSCQPNISAALVVMARITSREGIPALCKVGNLDIDASPRVFRG